MVICDSNSAETALKAIESIKNSTKKIIPLLSLDKVNGIESLKIENLKSTKDANVSSPIKTNDIEENICLLL